jgi:homogentisate 1,2-dioxygenase
MTPHGPDATTFEKATNEELVPRKFEGGLAFMFETKYQLKLTEKSVSGEHRQLDYADCWNTLTSHFNPEKK